MWGSNDLEGVAQRVSDLEARFGFFGVPFGLTIPDIEAKVAAVESRLDEIERRLDQLESRPDDWSG